MWLYVLQLAARRVKPRPPSFCYMAAVLNLKFALRFASAPPPLGSIVGLHNLHKAGQLARCPLLLIAIALALAQ